MLVRPRVRNYFDQHWHDGVGIVMDDVVAGLFAGFALYLLMYGFYLL